MLLTIPDVLNAAQVTRALEILNAAEWVDGKVTAGHQSARAKDNMQLPEGSPAARELGEMILDALGQSPLFISAALPLHVFPPLFNRYRAANRSARTSITPCARFPEPATAFAPTFPRHCSSRDPKNTTAANSSSKTPTASTA